MRHLDKLKDDWYLYKRYKHTFNIDQALSAAGARFVHEEESITEMMGTFSPEIDPEGRVLQRALDTSKHRVAKHYVFRKDA